MLNFGADAVSGQVGGQAGQGRSGPHGLAFAAPSGDARCDPYARYCIQASHDAGFLPDRPARSKLARARRFEPAALEAIYRSFERPAYTLALRMTAYREDAREVVHDAMLHMFERIGQFRGESPFWGWLRQIVVNQALMRLRRDRSQIVETFDDTLHGKDSGPESVAWGSVADASLERAIQALPVITRSVIWLYHVEGYTHAEIAGLTGNSISFSKSQLARGTQLLRALLEDTADAAHG